jgi:DNA processing protein
MSRGCHRLLREGAELFESPSDLMPALGMEPVAAGRPRPATHPVLTALEGATLTADELAQRLGRSAAEVLVSLIELELAGAVARGPGGLFRLRGPR